MAGGIFGGSIGVLGAAALGAVNESMANDFKRCANPKLQAAGKPTVPMGPLGPMTCEAAFMSATSGCVHRTAIRSECASKGMTYEEPSAIQQTFIDWGLIQGATAQQQLEQERMSTSTQYPWGVYSEATAALQRRINSEGEKIAKASNKPSYCQVKVDGKLGQGTCGAARNLGIATPGTCKSYATGCVGTLIDVQTQKPASYQPPQPKPTPSGPAPVAPTTTDVDAYVPPKEFPWAEVLIGTSVVAALGVIGAAVAKKKGWIGKKKVRGNRSHVRRKNVHPETRKTEYAESADYMYGLMESTSKPRRRPKKRRSRPRSV